MSDSDNGEKEQSNDRFLDRSTFPQPRTVNATNPVFLTFEELNRLLPDRVHLGRMAISFNRGLRNKRNLGQESALSATTSRRSDNISRTSHVRIWPLQILFKHVLRLLFEKKNQYAIKLANDGFIYPSSSTLETDPSYNGTYHYHGSTGWNRLSTGTLEAHFWSVIDFAKKFFKISDIQEVLYNENRERIHFRFKVSDPARDRLSVPLARRRQVGRTSLGMKSRGMTCTWLKTRSLEAMAMGVVETGAWSPFRRQEVIGHYIAADLCKTFSTVNTSIYCINIHLSWNE